MTAGPAVVTVMPTFNEGDRLFAFLEDWARIGITCAEVRVTALVVDDGSRGPEAARQRQAVEAATGILRRAGSPHVVHYHPSDRNEGKGASVRRGWTQADGSADWLGFIDADGAVPAREYWRVAGQLPSVAADAVCGSRVKMAGRTIERSLFRHLQGRGFATAVEELFHLGFYDTQCGFKFFRAAMLRPLLPTLREDRWLLDIEVLARLHAAGGRMIEVPVDCFQHGTSSLRFGIDPVRMAFRLLRLRRRLNRTPSGTP